MDEASDGLTSQVIILSLTLPVIGAGSRSSSRLRDID